MSHLETLVAEYLEWQGFLVRRNTKVGRLPRGGYEMELDVVGYHPKSNTLVHYEPSIDAIGWPKREARYKKKFDAGKKYIFTEIFLWVPPTTPLQQIAVFVDHPRDRHTIAGGTIMSIDEFMAQVRSKIVACGMMSKNAVPEQYPLLRTIQLSHSGYYRVISEK
jgi:hypothetical protein